MAYPNDMSRIVQGLSKLEAPNPDYTGSPKNAARALIRRSICFSTASVNANGSNAIRANAAASQRMMANGRVLGAYFIPQGTATAATANNANMKVSTVYANGVVNTVLASLTTNTTANGGSGDLAAGVAITLTVTDLANSRFTKGTVIGPEITQNSSGVAMPAGTIQVDFELEGTASDYDV
jgi:hypothetical protein